MKRPNRLPWMMAREVGLGTGELDHAAMASVTLASSEAKVAL